jgi:hypothetical protein
MTNRKKVPGKKPKLRKETLKDLGVGGKAKKVKGGIKVTFGMTCGCPTNGCGDTTPCPIPMPYPLIK